MADVPERRFLKHEFENVEVKCQPARLPPFHGELLMRRRYEVSAGSSREVA
jgi:hypothetical protein